MATVTEYPALDTAVSGTWTTPTNVQADDGNTASVTIAAKNTTVDREQGNFGFDASIPAGATINSVQLEVEHRVTTTGGVAFLENLARIGSTNGAVNSDSAEPTALTARTYPNYARPGGGSWARDDLLDGTFKTRTRARSGNNATSVTYHWDYIRVTVDYTSSAPQTVSVTGHTSTSAFGAATVVTTVTVAVAGFASGSAFGAVTAAPGAVSTPVAGRASTSSFGAVTAIGPQEIPVAGRTSTASFGAVTVATGPVTVSVAGRASAAAFGTVTALPGATTVTITGHSSPGLYGAAYATGGSVTSYMSGCRSLSGVGV